MCLYTWDSGLFTLLSDDTLGVIPGGIANGIRAAPRPLPFRLTMVDGSSLTSLSELPIETLTDIGLYQANPMPDHNPATQHPPEWWGEAGGEWVTRNKTPVEIESALAVAQATKVAELKLAATNAVQQHLDAAARARGYESIATCVTYADEPAVSQFQKEGRAARAWRSKVWEICYVVLDDVLAGRRAPLTPAEMVAELPPIVWPD